jgi:UDP-hydrolysing UDP-N-acetyl-D-glucosamine 2-epimerase
MTRTIAVVTGTRAEYGLLRPVVEALHATPQVDVGLIATGVHLQKEYGHTIDAITADPFELWGSVPMYEKLGEDFTGLPQALAAALHGLNQILADQRPDIVVVLGDRLEAMAAALAAFYRRIPVAHLHGGETSAFHMDDSTRHAVTRLAHLHFPATEASAERLRAMGEEDFRIHRCGAPGLDALRRLERQPKAAVMNEHGFSGERPFALFLFHPETTRWQEAGNQAATVLKSLTGAQVQVLALYPNGDPGSETIIETLKAFDSTITVRRHLPRDAFLQVLYNADVLVGNSSCGLIEACYTGTPVLHVGERNAGREHGANVIFVPIEAVAVKHGLEHVLQADFREHARRSPCPWGDGRAGRRIAEILAQVRLGPDLLAKKLCV